jgi:leucyl-tRNA synthetase
MFEHYYCNKSQKGINPFRDLVSILSKTALQNIDAACTNDHRFYCCRWLAKTEKEQQQEILLNYRIAYLADTMVNWCPALGTVLANDEVKDGLSVRGGHPVEQRVMRQWSLRVSAYAERLLNGLGQYRLERITQRGATQLDWPFARCRNVV